MNLSKLVENKIEKETDFRDGGGLIVSCIENGIGKQNWNISWDNLCSLGRTFWYFLCDLACNCPVNFLMTVHKSFLFLMCFSVMALNFYFTLFLIGFKECWNFSTYFWDFFFSSSFPWWLFYFFVFPMFFFVWDVADCRSRATDKYIYFC